MDHIETVFQKQQALWNAIFGGRTPSVRESGSDAAQDADSGEATRLETALAAAGTANGSFPSSAAGGAWSLLPTETAAAEAAALLSSGFLRETAAQAAPGAPKIGDLTGVGARRAAFPREDGTETLRMETEIAAPAAPSDAADARELSRRFERDARRYDGDYLFY